MGVLISQILAFCLALHLVTMSVTTTEGKSIGRFGAKAKHDIGRIGTVVDDDLYNDENNGKMDTGLFEVKVNNSTNSTSSEASKLKADLDIDDYLDDKPGWGLNLQPTTTTEKIPMDYFVPAFQDPTNPKPIGSNDGFDSDFNNDELNKAIALANSISKSNLDTYKYKPYDVKDIKIPDPPSYNNYNSDSSYSSSYSYSESGVTGYHVGGGFFVVVVAIVIIRCCLLCCRIADSETDTARANQGQGRGRVPIFLIRETAVVVQTLRPRRSNSTENLVGNEEGPANDDPPTYEDCAKDIPVAPSTQSGGEAENGLETEEPVGPRAV